MGTPYPLSVNTQRTIEFSVFSRGATLHTLKYLVFPLVATVQTVECLVLPGAATLCSLVYLIDRVVDTPGTCEYSISGLGRLN